MYKIDLNITGEELDIIMTAMEITLHSYDKYVAVNGFEKLDFKTVKAHKEMKDLYDKLNYTYY